MKNKKSIVAKKEISATSQEKKPITLSHARLGNKQVMPDKMLIIVSGEHKVKVLVLSGKDYEWFDHTGSLKEFLGLLSGKKFERINKFYVLNWELYSSYNPKTKTIFFNTGFSLRLKHPIKQTVFIKKFS